MCWKLSNNNQKSPPTIVSHLLVDQCLSVVIVTGVLEEAEFYNITSLIKLIKDKIRERDCKTSQVCDSSSQTETLLLSVPCLTLDPAAAPPPGPREACVQSATVPGGGADADGVHHV